VHPVTVLAIDALATNLDLNLGDHLLTREVKPASVHTIVGSPLAVIIAAAGIGHRLIDLGERHLKVGAVGQITITANSTCNTASEIGLAVKGLLN
jgi:hypothetical protein